jgi:hypothetical protein
MIGFWIDLGLFKPNVRERELLMVDTYTKIVLTVIAMALVAIVAQTAMQQANAQMDGCGAYRNPCAVTTRSDDFLNVKMR